MRRDTAGCRTLTAGMIIIWHASVLWRSFREARTTTGAKICLKAKNDREVMETHVSIIAKNQKEARALASPRGHHFRTFAHSLCAY